MTEARGSDGQGGGPASTDAPRRSGRGRAAFVLLLLAVLTGVMAPITWFTTTVTTALTSGVVVEASGSDVAPAVTAAALVLLACAAAVALVGRAGRWVVVVVVAGAGLLVVVASSRALADPWAAGLHQQVVTAAGVATDEAPVSTSAAPYVSVAVGALAVLAAGWLARASRSWPGPTRLHEGTTGPQPPVEDERTAWDALSRGDDPS